MSQPSSPDAPTAEPVLQASASQARDAAFARADQGRRTLAGIGSMILAVGLFAAMDAIVKWLSDSFPLIELVFFRSLFALLPLGLLMARSGGWRQLRVTRPGLHLLRSSVGLVSMYLYFVSYKLLPLADAFALGFIS